MAAKTVPSWQQQPVAQTDIQSLHVDRVNGGASYAVTVVYEIRDELTAVRFTKTISTTVAAWPASPASTAAILAAINAAQGT